MSKPYNIMDAWQKVQLARDSDRPKAQDYIHFLFNDFIELHGDRKYGDDPAVIGGIGFIESMPVTIIAQSKGSTLEENIEKKFGMVSPEGYRKALRLARQAEKFHRPIVTFIDTPGAYPGKGAEERGQAEAIAQCLYQFSDLRTPIIGIVLSEGGSGGALAFSVADHLIMLEHAIYSILSPEGFASILWKDESLAQKASEIMGLTSEDLKVEGFVDTIIPEPEKGAQADFYKVANDLRRHLVDTLMSLKKKRIAALLEQRYKKIRELGVPL